jgi:hypothetical protein
VEVACSRGGGETTGTYDGAGLAAEGGEVAEDATMYSTSVRGWEIARGALSGEEELVGKRAEFSDTMVAVFRLSRTQERSEREESIRVGE